MRGPDRWWLAIALALVAGAAQAAEPAAKKPLAGAEVRAAAQQLDRAVRTWLDDGAARGDGYVYGMDVAPLLLYAAERNDEALYARLTPAAQKLILAGTGDANTDGFVLWRQKDGQAPEVSGATEALWMARALWSGSRAFKRSDDKALAVKVLEGYARHADEQHGTWLVRKYFAFSTRAYAGLSVLPNYQADFLTETEGAAARVRGLGKRSYNVVQRAVSPSKLLLPLIQPEVGQDFPKMNVHRYAPNGIVALEDSCLGAEGAQRGLPQIARSVITFAADPKRRDANGRLHAYYHRRSGQPVGALALSSTGYACLARLAVAVNDRPALAAFEPTLNVDMLALASAPQEQAAPLYAAGPLLRAAHALRAFE